MAIAHTKGTGWFKQSVRHSNARRFGKAGGCYARKYTIVTGIDKDETTGKLSFPKYEIKDTPEIYEDIKNRAKKKSYTKGVFAVMDAMKEKVVDLKFENKLIQKDIKFERFRKKINVTKSLEFVNRELVSCDIREKENEYSFGTQEQKKYRQEFINERRAELLITKQNLIKEGQVYDDKIVELEKKKEPNNKLIKILNYRSASEKHKSALRWYCNHIAVDIAEDKKGSEING